MLQNRYFENPSFKIQPKRMSEHALSELYSARPVINSDVIFYREPSSVFLPIRNFQPAKGLWVIGGARLAGETAVEAIARRVKAETSLEIEPTRFKPMGVIEYIWPCRHQPPQDQGRHDINYIFGLAVTNDELKTAAASLDPEEYDIRGGLREFKSVAELKAAGVRANIVDYYQELFK